jgi:alkylated DNA repair dioxygenase AlkB
MPLNGILQDTCQAVSYLTGAKFNFILNNRYAGLHEHLSHHRDDEKDLIPGPIASCVVGASRTFEFKYIKNKDVTGDKPNASCRADSYNRVRFTLHHSDILVMVRQGRWTHAIPKASRGIQLEPHLLQDGSSTTVRFSITLRNMF